MPVLCQEYMLFFCLPLSSQPRLRLLRPLSISQHISAYKKNKGGAGGWGGWGHAPDYSMANKKIAYTLGRGRAYIFDMSSTSGYMGAK